MLKGHKETFLPEESLGAGIVPQWIKLLLAMPTPHMKELIQGCSAHSQLPVNLPDKWQMIAQVLNC